eukprot:SAG22_NODE_2748_length_2252_cov_2.276823_2_plen_59_part_00
MLKWIRTNGCEWKPAVRNAVEEASANGHLEVVKWCLENSTKFSMAWIRTSGTAYMYPR